MEKRIFILVLLVLSSLQGMAQHLSRNYHRTPLAQVLTDIDNADSHYIINFIYDELEDFTVTTAFQNRTIPNAVREVVGFYPMLITVQDSLIFVECTQKTPQKVIGRVTDSQGKPIAFANVALLNPADSSFINGGVTNDGGDFVIPCRRRRVLVRISYVGYETVWRTIEGGQLGTIRMKTDSYTLRDIQVKAVRKVIKNSVDRLQYLVSNDPYALGLNAWEVMNRVPLLHAEGETVSIIGKSATHFMLNGHIMEMGEAAVKAKLRSLKAEDIERIEVITIPPAKYKAEANGGYVNIVTRRNESRGWSGSLTIEPQLQYRARLMPEATVNYVSPKFEMSTSVRGDVGHVINKQFSVYSFDDGRQRTSDRVNKLFWPTAYMSTIMKYMPTNRWEIGVMGSLHMDRLRGDQTDITIDQDTVRSTSHTPGAWNYSMNATLYADYRIDSLGKMVSLNYNIFNSDDPARSENESVTAGKIERLRTSSTGRYRIHALKLDFTLPFKNFYAEAGMALTSITNQTGINVENFLNGTWLRNTNESNDFNYHEQGLAAYVSGRKKVGKHVEAQAGLRYEYTLTKGEQLTLRQTDRNHYGRFFPSFHLGWEPREDHRIGFAINWGIGRPNFNDLNPWRLYTTVHNYVTGNPHLTAAYSRNSEINYNNGRGLYLVLYNDHGTDEVGNNIVFNADGSQVGSPINGVSHDKSGLYITYRRNFLSWLNAEAEGEIYYHDAKAEGNSTIAPMHGWGSRLGSAMSFLLNRKKTLVASVNFYQDFSAYMQTQRIEPLSRLYFSLRYSCVGDRLKLSLSGGDPFDWNVTRVTGRYRGFSMRNRFDVHARYIGLRATWSFGGRHAKQIYHDNKDRESQRAPK